MMRRPKQQDEEAYFSKNVFLSVSGQLHLEAMCRGLGAVYNFGPAFRYYEIFNYIFTK